MNARAKKTNAKELSRQKRKFQNFEIYSYEEVSSTNDVAKEIAGDTSQEKMVIVAETQTFGKGRLGRRWISPLGGLWFSVILRPKILPEDATQLTFIMASTVAETISQMFGLKTEIKWPNDVLVEGRKICGILSETNTKKRDVEYVIVGVGINANVDLESFGCNLRDNATSLKFELGHKIKRKVFLRRLLESFDLRYQRLQRGQWRSLLQEWKKLASFLGKQVEVTSFDEISVGVAYDVDENGALKLKLENGATKKIMVGDVTLREKS